MFAAATAASVALGGWWPVAAATSGSQAAPLGPEIAHALTQAPLDPTGLTTSVGNVLQEVINAEVQTATADLATALSQPHAGIPEILTHPAADSANAGVRPAVGAASVKAAAPAGSVPGLDVASYQGNVNWGAVAAQGNKFAYAKATEGTYYTNPYFAQQYQGSYHQGLVRGAYHFAVPNNSTGEAQADFFVAHGGAWAPDHQTLPGMLDLEYNPYGPSCYGLSHGQMVGWITAFVDRYHSDTTRWPVIYTTANWWSSCTGSNGSLAAGDALFIANYNGTAYPLAAGWSSYTFWQYADHGSYPADQDVFNAPQGRLVLFADGGPPAPSAPPAPSPPPPSSAPPPNLLNQVLANLLAAVTGHP